MNFPLAGHDSENQESKEDMIILGIWNWPNKAQKFNFAESDEVIPIMIPAKCP